jgi:regulation of enolase protein 1 (concanavalin A-like superfamily)
VSITLAASDKEGSPLTWSIVSGPTKGKLSGTAPNLTYTPNSDTNGADSFTYKANDGSANSTDATVSITVTPKGNTQVNRPPVFKSNPVTLQSAVEGTSYTGVSIADAASDPDQGDSITFAKTAGPEWLEISSAGKLSGTPPAGSEGVNRFTVRATDTAGAYADSILLIEISAADLPLPWELERIGKITGKSRAAHKAGTFTLASSGNLAGKSDSGAFIWQTLTGDGEIIARVNGLDDAGKTSRAGLMIRDTLAANSRHVFIGVNGGGDFRWVRRTRTGGQTLMTPEGAGAVPKVWLRLVRKGETIIASKSANGSDWTRVGSTTVDFGKNCYIGISISSGDATPSTATFRGVTVNP